MREPVRCVWCMKDPLYVDYHDREWGVPIHDDRLLFEFLLLEGAQAGLSWFTVLKKRERYRLVFDGFDAQKISKYDDRKVQMLLADVGIIRNRLKVAAAISNAKAFLEVSQEWGSFDRYIWSFVNFRAIQNHWPDVKSLPAISVVSDAMSRDLKKRGFRFVGSTICYAFMQAVGMVNDHTIDCFRHKTLAA